MRLDARLLRLVPGLVCVVSLSCAAPRQLQLDRAREQLKTYEQYQVPANYREQLDRYFDTVVRGSRSVMLAEPSGAIVCGHLKVRDSPAGYQPFGAIFDRAGSLRWARIYQPFQGMYATGASNPRPTDDDVAIAIACNIPLVF